MIAPPCDECGRYDGMIPDGTGLRCDECPQPAVWSVPVGRWPRLACSNAVHIAWAESCGSAVPVDYITTAHGFPVDESTVPELPACGCPIYGDIDGTFTIEHDCGRPRRELRKARQAALAAEAGKRDAGELPALPDRHGWPAA